MFIVEKLGQELILRGDGAGYDTIVISLSQSAAGQTLTIKDESGQVIGTAHFAKAEPQQTKRKRCGRCSRAKRSPV